MSRASFFKRNAKTSYDVAGVARVCRFIQIHLINISRFGASLGSVVAKPRLAPTRLIKRQARKTLRSLSETLRLAENKNLTSRTI